MKSVRRDCVITRARFRLFAPCDLGQWSPALNVVRSSDNLLKESNAHNLQFNKFKDGLSCLKLLFYCSSFTFFTVWHFFTIYHLRPSMKYESEM